MASGEVVTSHKRLWEVGATAALLLVVFSLLGGYFAHENSKRTLAERRRSLSQELAQVLSQEPVEARAAVQLIRRGADPETRGAHEDRTALVLAASQGDSASVWYLLSVGADPNARNRYGQTALHFAVMQADLPGSSSVVQQLVQAGTDLNFQDQMGCTPLMLAAERWGTEPQHRVILQTLLDAGARVNVRHPMSGYTALHLAAASGNAYAVKLLLAHRADPQISYGGTKTALHLAEEWGHSEIVRVLKRHQGRKA